MDFLLGRQPITGLGSWVAGWLGMVAASLQTRRQTWDLIKAV